MMAVADAFGLFSEAFEEAVEQIERLAIYLCREIPFDFDKDTSAFFPGLDLPGLTAQTEFSLSHLNPRSRGPPENGT